MPRRTFPVFLIAMLAPGCATGTGGGRAHCHTNPEGDCGQELIAAAIIGGALVVAGVTYAAITRRSDPPAERVAPPHRPLVGQVRWEDWTAARPVPVALRAAGDRLVGTTTTEEDGSFRFPFPRKPGWYTVSAAGGGVEGETTFWLQDQPPAALEVVLRPIPTTTAPPS